VRIKYLAREYLPSFTTTESENRRLRFLGIELGFPHADGASERGSRCMRQDTGLQDGSVLRCYWAPTPRPRKHKDAETVSDRRRCLSSCPPVGCMRETGQLTNGRLRAHASQFHKNAQQRKKRAGSGRWRRKCVASEPTASPHERAALLRKGGSNRCASSHRAAARRRRER